MRHGPVAVPQDSATFPAQSFRRARVLHDADPYAVNRMDAPDRVVPRTVDEARLTDGVVDLRLPQVSWTVVELGALSA